MNIEIHGAGFNNKGAELMLRTTVEKLRSSIPGAVLSIDPFYGKYEQRSGLGLRQMFPERQHVGKPDHSRNLKRQVTFSKPLVKKLFSKLTGSSMDDYALSTISSVTGFIDISGFAFTEQWGNKPTVDFSFLTSRYNKMGVPVIMLPQALGPFNNPAIKDAFKRVVDNASLIYARDETSYSYAKEVVDSDNIKLAPDITLFSYQDSHDPIPEYNKPYVSIIPNSRMLDQGKEKWNVRYEEKLKEYIKFLNKRSIKACIVVHDTSGQDLKLCKKILSSFRSGEAELVQIAHPFALKKFLGNSIFVIGSRFHGLVSSLSKNIPCIALGWSHKYEMLFKDFNMSEFIISSDDSIDKDLSKLEHLCTENENKKVRTMISERLDTLKLVNSEMWDQVINVLHR